MGLGGGGGAGGRIYFDTIPSSPQPDLVTVISNGGATPCKDYDNSGTILTKCSPGT